MLELMPLYKLLATTRRLLELWASEFVAEEFGSYCKPAPIRGGAIKGFSCTMPPWPCKTVGCSEACAANSPIVRDRIIDNA